MDLTVDKNLDDLTINVVATFDHPVEKVWQLYADPRKLERWWGPPTYPATVTEHDLTPGGRVRYYMTSPEGEQYHAFWEVQQVDEGKAFTVVDKFADADGNEVESMPASTTTFSFSEDGAGSRMSSVTEYASRADLEKVLEMGMEEGLTGAMGQMEGVLADS